MTYPFYWQATINGHTIGSGAEVDWGEVKTYKDIEEITRIIKEQMEGTLKKVLVDKPKGLRWITDDEKEN